MEAAAGTLFAYNPDTGTETETDYTESSGGITLDKDAHTVTYSLSDVPAGVYMIKISFYSDAEKTNLAGTWRELAVITGGQKSGASRVMDVFVKHTTTIDPKKDGGLSGITQKTSSVEGIVTLAENTDGTYTLTSQGMGTSVLTFSGTNAGGESVAVTYNVSVSDTGELTVGSPKVVYSVTVAGGIEHGTVTAKPAPAAAGETVTLTVTPESGYAGAIAIKNASGEDISSSVSLSQDSEDTTKWTFTMPEGTVTISAIFEDTEPFTTTLKQGRGLYGDGINGILTYRLSSSAKQFKKSSTRNASATEYLDINNKIPVWYDSSSETIYYYIPASCTSVKMNEDSSYMFQYMKYLTSIEINGFDTSAVTNMWAMFDGCSALKSLDLSSFDTRNVTGMSFMFYGCTALESLNLGDNFDTSKVTAMEGMFANCTALESSDLSSFIDTIDTSSVTDMSQMFAGCTALTSLDLRSFNTSSVTKMKGMFSGCTSLESLDLSSFNTSKVENMQYMFSGCSALESLDLSKFDTSKVTTMETMFCGCSKLTSLDLRSFNTSSVTDMDRMFEKCTVLESLDLSSFNTSSVTEMNSMFANCTALTSLDVSKFDTSKVTSMMSIFGGCSSLKTIYASDTFVTTNVNISYYTGQYCFSGCTSLVGGSGTTYDENKIHATYARIDGGESAPGYFTAPELVATLKTGIDINEILLNYTYDMELGALETVQFKKSTTNSDSTTQYLDTDEKIPVWADSENKIIYYYIPDGYAIRMNADSSEMFANISFASIDIAGFDTSAVTNMSKMFSWCNALESLDVTGFDTSKVTDMSYMFANCSGLKSLDVTGFDTSKVTNMKCMFNLCSELTSLDVSNFNTSAVTNMNAMFSSCSKLPSLDLHSFDTSAVEDMEAMFVSCSSLTSLDVSSFNTSAVTNMREMFYLCSELTSLDLSAFDTSAVTDMTYMFNACGKLAGINLSSFDTRKVTVMSGMFQTCPALTSLDLSSFDTSAVTDMGFMFSECSALEKIYATNQFVTTNVESDFASNLCFAYCTSLKGGAGTTYDSSRESADYARIDGGTDAPGYFTLKPIGSKSKPDAVGDIVFSDGSATPYTPDLTLNEEQKAAAIAVIFYVGTDCSNDSTSRTLGVGLAQNHGGLAWCLDSANAVEVNITTIQESDKDGSDNLSQIGEFLNDNNDTGTADKYPAFYFAENYSGTATNLGETYADGWYLPAKAELQKIYDILSTVNKELAACGGTTFDTSGVYWSSSQYASAGYVAYGLNFASGGWNTRTKGHSSYSVCAVRAFN